MFYVSENLLVSFVYYYCIFMGAVIVVAFAAYWAFQYNRVVPRVIMANAPQHNQQERSSVVEYVRRQYGPGQEGEVGDPGEVQEVYGGDPVAAAAVHVAEANAGANIDPATIDPELGHCATRF